MWSMSEVGSMELLLVFFLGAYFGSILTTFARGGATDAAD